jgi:heat shock protein HslJ
VKGAKLIVVLGIAAVIATGCGSSGDGDVAGTLWHSSYVSTNFVEAGQPKALAPHTRLSLAFGNSRSRPMSWSAGCNSFGAEVQITEQTLEVGEIGGTLIGCMPKLEAQDEWLSDFFASNPEWRLTGNQLTLTSGDAVIELKTAEG